MPFLQTLRSLSFPKQLALGGAVGAVVLLLSLMVQTALKPPMALLYAGLSPERSGEIIDELEQRNVAYDIRGGSIFVTEDARDKVRFALARDGLPRQAVQGYELLDEVNGFSVTSEMYNAAYWRAKEGELTRTILAIPGVEAARVHIGASLRSGFSRSQPAQTASVTLTTAYDLAAEQAEAIQYLVALAVAGLAAEDVAVIDSRAGIIAGPHVELAKAPAKVADTEAAALEQKVLRLLEARVGPGNARVSVSVDVSRERQLVSSVTFDPDSRIVRSRTSNDNSESSSGGNGGLTVASNLPQGGGAQGGTSSTARTSTESVTYEVNEVRTETERLPGEIQRISIAVMLNQATLEAGAATPDTARLQTEFEQLIASAAGLDQARGDVVTVEVMPFQPAPADEMVTPPGAMQKLLERYFWPGLQAFLLGLVVIVLGLGVVRPILKQGQRSATPDADADLPDDEALRSGAAPADPFEFLKDYTREREDETAALLQAWLTEDDKIAVNE